MLSPSERSQRARIAAHARSAAYDGLVVTAKGRQAFADGFYQQAVAAASERGEQLSETELRRRAAALKKLHFARLSFASLKARQGQKKSKLRRGVAAADRNDGPPEVAA